MGEARGSAADTAVGAMAPPRQARSRRTYHRLLEAAEALLAERSFDEVTIDEIAERAGYTKGAFYARFDSKGALLRHLVARLTDGAREAWEAYLDPGGWEGVPAAEVVEAFVRRMAAVYTRGGHVMAAIEREVRFGGDEAIRGIVADVNDGVATGFVRLMTHRREELPRAVRSDVEGACRYWLAALTAVLRAVHLSPVSPGGGVVEEGAGARVDRTVRLMVPYLTERRPEPG